MYSWTPATNSLPVTIRDFMVPEDGSVVVFEQFQDFVGGEVCLSIERGLLVLQNQARGVVRHWQSELKLTAFGGTF